MSKMCPGFTLIQPSTSLCLLVCHEVAIYFCCDLDCFCFGSSFGFGGSGVEIKPSGLHVSICGEDLKMFVEFMFEFMPIT